MFKKLMFISSILFICLVSISFVCATDNLTDENILTVDDSSDEKIIADSQNDETLAEGEGNFTELFNLISDSDGSLNLTKDYKRVVGDNETVPLEYGLDINKTITINGNGHTIDGNKSGRILRVNAPNVVLENITFINGKREGSDGGALYVNGVNLTVKNCRFENNSAAADGGAVGVFSGKYCTISNCTFVNNQANFGGAIWWYADYGTISGCTFVKNSAKEEGGGVCWS